jgi:hypothetical protein
MTPPECLITRLPLSILLDVVPARNAEVCSNSDNGRPETQNGTPFGHGAGVPHSPNRRSPTMQQPAANLPPIEIP